MLHQPHSELQWVATSLGLNVLPVLAAITLDGTTIVVAIIGLISTFLTLYFAYLMSKNTKATEDTAKKLESTNSKVDGYHLSVNSKVDELLRITRQAALAEGHLAGVREEKARKGTEDAYFMKGKEATKLEVDLDIPEAIKKKLDLP